MTALQMAAQSNMSTVGSGWSKGTDFFVSEKFPDGLSILVVDDDAVCLRVLEGMLTRLCYHVTICSQATEAWDLLKKSKGHFDMVLSDVHMPGMDGYKLLELVGLGMDLPVIMMSADGRTSAVMRGIKHGACDYLIKPISKEELKNIWQHVARKKLKKIREVENSESFEDNGNNKHGNEETGASSSISESIEGALKHQKRRSLPKEEEEDETENDDPAASKKPRVVWSVELHQQFVSAVNQLGIDKAVPKRILELMNVPGLTRENVASHLQKFRLYLKRLSGVAQPGASFTTLCGSMEPNIKVGSAGRCDFQSLAASGQMHPQTLASLLSRPVGSVINSSDPHTLLQTSLQGVKCLPVEHSMSFGQQMMEYPCNSPKQCQTSLMPTDDLPSSFGAWPQNTLNNVGGSQVIASNSWQNNLVVDASSHQQSYPQSFALREPDHTINVQPSCQSILSQSSNNCTSMRCLSSINENSNFNRGAILDYSSLMLNNLFNNSDAYLKSNGFLSGCSVPSRSLSPTTSSCSVSVESSMNFQAQTSNNMFRSSGQHRALASGVGSVRSSYITKSTEMLSQIPNETLLHTSLATSVPAKFALNDIVSSVNGPAAINSNRVKQEPETNFTESVKVSSQQLRQFPSNDLMGIFTK